MPDKPYLPPQRMGTSLITPKQAEEVAEIYQDDEKVRITKYNKPRNCLVCMSAHAKEINRELLLGVSYPDLRKAYDIKSNSTLTYHYTNHLWPFATEHLGSDLIDYNLWLEIKRTFPYTTTYRGQYQWVIRQLVTVRNLMLEHFADPKGHPLNINLLDQFCKAIYEIRSTIALSEKSSGGKPPKDKKEKEETSLTDHLSPEQILILEMARVRKQEKREAKNGNGDDKGAEDTRQNSGEKTGPG